jgi:hypothetical protein
MVMNKTIKQIGCSVLIIIIVIIGVYFYSLLNAFFDIATGPSGRSIKNFEKTPVYEFALAIDDDDVDRLKYLLENKPPDLDINYISRPWKLTLMGWALINDKQNSLECLLKYGANPFLHKQGRTTDECTFIMAIERCKIDVLNSIFRFSSIDSIPPMVAGSALTYAYSNCPEALTLLFENKVHEADKDGYSVYVSIIQGHWKFALELMRMGVPFNNYIEMSEPYTTDDPVLDKTICYYIYNNRTAIRDVDEVTRDRLIKYLKINKGINVFDRKNLENPRNYNTTDFYNP